MPSSPPPGGVYVPVPTFFLPRSSPKYDAVASPVDTETQGKHSVHLAKSGIRGLVILGSTGEAVHLTTKERFEVLDGARKALEAAGFKDYPIIAGTATQNIEECVEQMNDAKKTGAQWGLVLAPGYFAGAVSQEGIIKWYEAVADRSPIPIMIPLPWCLQQCQTPPSTMTKLASHPNIVGCKLSHGDVSHHAQIGASSKINHEHFATFTGLGQQLLPIMALGCAGTIDGTAGFFPKSVVHLYNLCLKINSSEAGSSSAEIQKEARALQAKLSAVEEIVVKFGTVGIKEAVSRLLGFGDRDGTRLPLFGGIPGGDAEWKNWQETMDELEAVEKSIPEVK